MALDGKLEDTSYHSRRFLIDQPVVFVIEVFLVTIDGAVGGGLPDSPLTQVACAACGSDSSDTILLMILTKGANSLELGPSLSMLFLMAIKQTPNLRKRTSV